MKTVFVLGINADIGAEMAHRFLSDGFRVVGSYRRENDNVQALKRLEAQDRPLTLVRCDVTSVQETQALGARFEREGWKWDLFFSSVGTTEPIGPFFDLDFADWERSVDVNSVSQLRALHSLYRFRATEGVPSVCFLAGGGTNNVFVNYSAYTAAKIFLIKMCEQLDVECPDLKVFIVGPGLVRTRTHLETLRAGQHAGQNLDRIQKFWDSKDPGTSMDDIYSCICWLDAQDRAAVGGRNFSVVHDIWGDGRLTGELQKDPAMYKLRRVGNEFAKRTPR